MKILTPGVISRLLGVPRHRLYYMEERGQIPSARRSENGKRFYTLADLKRLQRVFAKGR